MDGPARTRKRTRLAWAALVAVLLVPPVLAIESSGAITGGGTSAATAAAFLCPGQTTTTSTSSTVINPGGVTTVTTTSTVPVPFPVQQGIALTKVAIAANGKGVILTVLVRCPGTLTGKATHTADPMFVFPKDSFAGPNHDIIVATGKTVVTTQDATVTVPLKSTTEAAQLWTHHYRLRIRISLYYSPTGGGAGTSLTRVVRY